MLGLVIFSYSGIWRVKGVRGHVWMCKFHLLGGHNYNHSGELFLSLKELRDEGS